MTGATHVRRLGDLTVGEIALGGADWSLREIDPVEVRQTIGVAIEAGVTLIDTAYVYTTATEQNHNRSWDPSMETERRSRGARCEV